LGAIVRWQHDGAESIGVVMFATQRPYIVGFLSASEKKTVAGASSSSSSSSWVPSAKHVFELAVGRWVYSDDHDWPDGPVDVLLNTAFVQFGFVTSEDEWLLVRVVIDSLPPAKGDAAAEADKAAPVLKPSRSVIAERSWPLDLYIWNGHKHNSAGE
jgi:hypothetical protein